jgi:hypothetical protein
MFLFDRESVCLSPYIKGGTEGTDDDFSPYEIVPRYGTDRRKWGVFKRPQKQPKSAIVPAIRDRGKQGKAKPPFCPLHPSKI